MVILNLYKANLIPLAYFKKAVEGVVRPRPRTRHRLRSPNFILLYFFQTIKVTNHATKLANALIQPLVGFPRPQPLTTSVSHCLIHISNKYHKHQTPTFKSLSTFYHSKMIIIRKAQKTYT